MLCEAFWDEAAHLRDTFKFEFFYPPKAEFENRIRDELARYNPTWETALCRGARQKRFLKPLFRIRRTLCYGHLLKLTPSSRMFSPITRKALHQTKRPPSPAR